MAASDAPRGNAIIGQSGGPTAVINQSLVGVVETLAPTVSSGPINKILGMRHGVRGLLEENLIDLTDTSKDTLEAIAGTPSAALGSTRDKPDAAYCEQIFETLKRNDVRYFFYAGGNDSSDTCRIVNELSNEAGYELRCFHIPKTVDNDLMENDHTPGYASAARYVAKAFAGDDRDNASLPGVKVNIVMGRHAGFLTAAAGLLRGTAADGPHLIYLPEVPISIDDIVGDVDRCMTEHGRCQVAVSEGIVDPSGEAIGAKLIGGEVDAHGNVQLSGSGALGDNIAALLKAKLKPVGGKAPRVRTDTLGYAQRSYPDASSIDQLEARAAAQAAARCALSGDLDGSIAIKRVSTDPYEARMERVDLSLVAAKTRHVPEEFLSERGEVSPSFFNWLRPLVGPMPTIASL